MKIIRLLCIVVCIHALASCIVTGKQKVALRFKDRQTLKPVAGMKVRLEWSDERPWRFAFPNTREGLTDTQGRVTFDSLAEHYWNIRAYRPGSQVGEVGFWVDAAHGVRFDCGSSRELIEDRRLVLERDRWSPGGPPPNLVMTAREIGGDGNERRVPVSVLRWGGFCPNRDDNYEHIKLRDD